MHRWITLVALLLISAMAASAADENALYWPQFRGPLASGVAPHGNPPLTWSTDENIRWKAEIPGKGLSTPIVWENRVFVLSAVETASVDGSQVAVEGAPSGRGRGIRPVGPVRFVVMALNRKTGAVVWEREARREVPHEGTHRDGSWASSSAITDGESLFAFFGSRGIYAYDMDGKALWETDLGNMSTRHGFGEGSSPALDGETLIINWDHEGASFIVALDKRTGETKWRQERDEVTSWSTPIIAEHGGKKQVVFNATGRVRGYDLETGEVIWEVGGMTVNAIPSPIHRAGIVFVTSGFRGSAFKAIRLEKAQGEVTEGEAIAWSYDRDTPYVPSALLYGDSLYFMKVNSNVITNLNPDTGAVHFGPERLDAIDGVYASPVGAADRVYVVGRNGTTVVLKRGPELEVLATNTLDDRFDASPAIAGNELFLRGRSHLYCIAEN